MNRGCCASRSCAARLETRERRAGPIVEILGRGVLGGAIRARVGAARRDWVDCARTVVPDLRTVVPDLRTAACASDGSPITQQRVASQSSENIVPRNRDMRTGKPLLNKTLRDGRIVADKMSPPGDFLTDTVRMPTPRTLPDLLAAREFTVLRHTIASRGTARMILLPVTFIAWASTALVVQLFGSAPVSALLPLAVLVGGFEAIHALHVGVERIGRYLQVYYEATHDGPRWETTVMAVGPALPGGGIDPLFSAIFVSAAFVNLLGALLPMPTRLELGVVGVLHVAFAVRVVRARGAAARQRAVELETFRAIHSQHAAHPRN